LEREFAAEHRVVTVDSARFQQVVWNLLRNAIKFSSSGGRVTIATSEVPGDDGRMWFRMEVRDQGVGIAPEMLDQIFKPFEQGAWAGSHQFGGMGLGLSIVRAVLKVHGGRISAQSDGLGRGATFVLELPGATPLPSEPASRAISADPLLGANGVASLRLLVVEDHESTLQALVRLLVRSGHQVVTAGSVAEALAAANSATFDLVLSDLGLPDGTGNELMRRLRDAHGLKGVALSGYGMEEDFARSREAGFVAHLVKPVRIAELRRVIENVRPRQGG
jgi:CheY-like chemotaxis protein